MGGAPARVREPDGEAVEPGLRPGGAPPEQEMRSGREGVETSSALAKNKFTPGMFSRGLVVLS